MSGRQISPHQPAGLRVCTCEQACSGAAVMQRLPGQLPPTRPWLRLPPSRAQPCLPSLCFFARALPCAPPHTSHNGQPRRQFICRHPLPLIPPFCCSPLPAAGDLEASSGKVATPAYQSDTGAGVSDQYRAPQYNTASDQYATTNTTNQYPTVAPATQQYA